MKGVAKVLMLTVTAGILVFASACKKNEWFGHAIPGGSDGNGTGNGSKKQYVYLVGYSTADKELRAYNTKTSKFTTIAKLTGDVASLRTIDAENGIYYFSRWADQLSIHGIDIRTGKTLSHTTCKDIYALEYNPNDGKMYGPVSDYTARKTSIGWTRIGDGNPTVISQPTCSWSSSGTTFDPENNCYIALQSDEQPNGESANYIRIIDVKSGKLIASHPLGISAFDYNINDGKLYGWTGYGTTMKLASMDIATGQVTTVSNISMGNISSGGNVIDPVNNIFYADEEGTIKGISMKTGEIVHDFDPPAYFVNWEVYVTEKPLGEESGEN